MIETPGEAGEQTPTSEPSAELAVLLQVLDLERIEQDIFRGQNLKTALPRLYGGQVAAQALVAASRTVPPDRPVHSLHSYFIRPGDPAVPVVFTVDRIRDGRSFTTRRAVGVQHGQAIYAMTASFQLPAPGLEHGDPMPDVPRPNELTSEQPERQSDGTSLGEAINSILAALDVRYVPAPDVTVGPIRVDAWIKAVAQLPDDPLLHTCMLVYASDLGVLESAFVRHRVHQDDVQLKVASLDHAMWFHRPHRADDWTLYSRHSPFTGGSRALGLGQMYNEGGELVVTVMQEAMFRSIR
jgi:acyl-CoA thioesterase-2